MWPIQKMRRNLLKRVPLFHDNSAEELDQLADSLSAECYAVGEVILRQGEAGDKFFIIEHGNVSIWQSSPDGEEKQVDKLGSGQYFGELALMLQVGWTWAALTRWVPMPRAETSWALTRQARMRRVQMLRVDWPPAVKPQVALSPLARLLPPAPSGF